jgi:DNA repair protein RecN (Recombination protein N)
MLHRLSIQNLAIIDQLTLDFSSGFTALTGETGAGKSIIISALNLVLGERASSDDVRTGCALAEVEALFDVGPNSVISRFLAESNLITEEESKAARGKNASPLDLVIRREVSAQGKSRCFINGRLVTLSQLAALGDLLVDLHGQHQHQSLLKVELHREILDAFGGSDIQPALAVWQPLFHRYKEVMNRMHYLARSERDMERQKGILEFQIKEISEAELVPGEDERLESERQRLEHVDALRRNTAETLGLLYENESSETPTAIDLLAQVENILSASARLDPSLETEAARLAGLSAEISDCASNLRSYEASLDADPERLAEVDDRVHLIRKLKKKYGASIEEVLEQLQKMEAEYASLTHSREEQEALEVERVALETQLVAAAENLTQKRREVAERLAKGICKHLLELEMPSVEFEARLTRETTEVIQSDEDDDADEAPASKSDVANALTLTLPDGSRCRIGEHGADFIEFLISTNRGEALKPLRKIASGGELSRIMLALKALLSGQEQIPTLVFDEIDTGISGRTGTRVGEKMERLSKECQVICITHLPQIAARAGHHFAVCKTKEKNRMLTRVMPLHHDERLSEIARLLGGENDSAIAREHAAELLSR